MKNRLAISLLLLLFLSTYQIQENFKIHSKFKVEEIFVENNNIVKKREIKKKLSYIYGSSIFFLDKKEIKINLSELAIIDSFEVKKVYPNKIKIKIFEKKPVAIIQNKKKKSYYTKKGEIINFLELKQFKELPLVFGDQESFKVFYQNLKNVNFPIDLIRRFYLFESKRWDLVTIKNQTIKLPVKDYLKSLKTFMDIKDQASFEKYKIFDYRIKDQLILK